MAFSDDAIRAVVATGAFTDPKAARLLESVLIARRDRIGRYYLPRINPVVDPALSTDGHLTFGNAAVDHHVATAPREYTAAWHAFDNTARTTRPLGETRGATPNLAAPAALPSAPGAYVRVDIAAEHDTQPAWRRPVEAYFRRDAAGWTLVGLSRQPSR